MQLTSEKKPLEEEVLPGEGVSLLSFFSSSLDTTTCRRKSYGSATAAFSSSENESLVSPGDAFWWLKVGEEEAELLPVQDSSSSLMPRIISSSLKSSPRSWSRMKSSSKTFGRNSSGGGGMEIKRMNCDGMVCVCQSLMDLDGSLSLESSCVVEIAVRMSWQSV